MSSDKSIKLTIFSNRRSENSPSIPNYKIKTAWKKKT
jgi:hypothetical protein